MKENKFLLFPLYFPRSQPFSIRPWYLLSFISKNISGLANSLHFNPLFRDRGHVLSLKTVNLHSNVQHLKPNQLLLPIFLICFFTKALCYSISNEAFVCNFFSTIAIIWSPPTFFFLFLFKKRVLNVLVDCCKTAQWLLLTDWNAFYDYYLYLQSLA